MSPIRSLRSATHPPTSEPFAESARFAPGDRVIVPFGNRFVPAEVLEERPNGRVRVEFQFDDTDEPSQSSYLPEEMYPGA